MSATKREQDAKASHFQLLHRHVWRLPGVEGLGGHPLVYLQVREHARKLKPLPVRYRVPRYHREIFAMLGHTQRNRGFWKDQGSTSLSMGKERSEVTVVTPTIFGNKAATLVARIALVESN